MRALGIVTLVVLVAFLGVVCKPAVEAPQAYASHELRGVSFNYPSGWIDETQEAINEMTEAGIEPGWEEYMALTAWTDPSGSAGLFVFVFDLEAMKVPELITDEEKQAFAGAFMGGLMTEVETPTLHRQEEIRVSGEWAWEAEFSGTMEGLAVKGHSLTAFHGRDAFWLMYFAEDIVWDKLGGVYDRVKQSISFD